MNFVCMPYVLFQRHALVFMSVKAWTTVKKKEIMTIGIVQEMCEIVLLPR